MTGLRAVPCGIEHCLAGRDNYFQQSDKYAGHAGGGFNLWSVSVPRNTCMRSERAITLPYHTMLRGSMSKNNDNQRQKMNIILSCKNADFC